MDASEQKRIVLRKARQKRSKEETAGFVLVIATGSLAVLLGGFYLARHVGQPFDFEYTGPQFFTSAERQQQEIEEQRNSDTDGDRLSDFDELYVLKTSPYLFDTDGDGIDDLAEVQAGTDPTCIEGTECLDSAFANATQDGEFFDVNELIDPLPASTQDVDEILTGVGSLTPDQIRELLISAGADASEVATLSDDQISELYQSVLLDLETSGELETLINEEQETP